MHRITTMLLLLGMIVSLAGCATAPDDESLPPLGAHWVGGHWAPFPIWEDGHWAK